MGKDDDPEVDNPLEDDIFTQFQLEEEESRDEGCTAASDDEEKQDN